MGNIQYGGGGPGYGMMSDAGFGLGIPMVMSFVLVVVLWTLLWKGLALWRAAKRGDIWWFIAMLVLNTVGLLEIVYLFVVSGAKLSDFTKKTTNQQ